MKLTRVERRWAEAAMGAIFPGSCALGFSDIRAMNVEGFLGELLGHLPWRAALGFRLALWLVALAPLFVLGRIATIARLAPLDRERVIAVLAASKWYAVRSLVLVVKAMGALLFAADDAVRSRMAPPHSGAVPLRARGVRVA